MSTMNPLFVLIALTVLAVGCAGSDSPPAVGDPALVGTWSLTGSGWDGAQPEPVAGGHQLTLGPWEAGRHYSASDGCNTCEGSYHIKGIDFLSLVSENCTLIECPVPPLLSSPFPEILADVFSYRVKGGMLRLRATSGLPQGIRVLQFIDPERLPAGTMELAAGDFSAISEPRFVALDDPAALNILWNEHCQNDACTGAPPHGIDFASATVIALFVGARPSEGFGIAAESLIETGGRVLVTAQLTQPGSSCFTPTVQTSPFQLLMVPKVTLPIDFVIEPEVRNCP